MFAKIENGTKFVKSKHFIYKKKKIFYLFLILVNEYGRNKILESAKLTHYFPKVKFDNISLENGYSIN